MFEVLHFHHPLLEVSKSVPVPPRPCIDGWPTHEMQDLAPKHLEGQAKMGQHRKKHNYGHG